MENNIKHVKTSSGFECDIDLELLDDMEVVEAIAEVDKDNGNLVAVMELVNKMFGTGDTKKELYDHLRTPKGTVPTQAFIKEFYEIFNGVKEVKNS